MLERLRQAADIDARTLQQRARTAVFLAYQRQQQVGRYWLSLPTARLWASARASCSFVVSLSWRMSNAPDELSTTI
jgi:predicted metal-dependent hydrolase